MPFPKTKDVSRLVKFLSKEKPNMPHKQVLAIALQKAREAGAKIPKKKGKK